MSGIKNIIYNTFSPLARFVLRNAIGGKRIHGSNSVLYYEKSQHLSFLFRNEIKYESLFRNLILEQVSPGDLVIEIGSNIGQHGLLISEKIGTQGKLICVEPDSTNFAFLSFNMLKNGRSNVELIRKAVSDKPGKTVFYKDTVTGGRMGSLIQKYAGKRFEGKSEEVELTTLADLIRKYGNAQFIKIDVEGAEAIIFSDPSIINPETTYMVEVRSETKEYIFQIFNERGFQIYLMEDKSRRMTRAEDIPDFADLLIKRK
jgi:FkbM family methyltransferase